MIETQAGIELESMEFHRDSKTYRVQYDQNTISPSMAVVASVTNVSGGNPLELAPRSRYHRH